VRILPTAREIAPPRQEYVPLIVDSSPSDDGQGVPSCHEISLSASPESCQKWPVSSWPVQLCSKCTSMTATTEGLRDLVSQPGYKHHRVEDLVKSAKKGCALCAFISNVVSRGFYQCKGLEIEAEWTLEEMESILISACCEQDESFHSDGSKVPSITETTLAFGYVSKHGRYYGAYENLPVSFLKLTIFADPAAPTNLSLPALTG
jgi:hypothetical protein